MPTDYSPFRDIRSMEDLLLAREHLGDAPATVALAEAYYPEICGWVTLDAPAEALLGEERTVLACDAWRLLLTEHGYLRFEGEAPGAPECESVVPAHAVVGGQGTRLGVAVCNYSWLLRDTGYSAEAAGCSALRLLAGGACGPLSRIGGASGWLAPEMAPAPDEIAVGLGPGEIAAFNCLDAGAIAGGDVRPADDLLPLVPGGSSFEPRWIDDRTVEVFTRPEFTRSSSYWVLLRVEPVEPMPERLVVRTTHRGGANMTPTFFASSDRERWRRVAPRRVEMGEGGAEFAAEFDASELAGRWLASAPPFGDAEREALLAWAREQQGVAVHEIGRSVEGRAIHAVHVGDGQRGVAVICGQHSPLEIMGGRVIEPMIRRLLDRPALLRAAQFVFVPTVNVDCAHYGGNGLNANQRNTNRHWLVDLQPENRAVEEHIDALRARGLRLELGLDIHAGGIFRNHVLMHMGGSDEVPVSAEAAAEQEVWRDLLEEHAGLRREDGRPLAQKRLRATDWLHQERGAVAFCLELSTCSFFDPRTQQTREFGQEAFEVLGEGIVAACEERLAAE